MYCHSFTIQLPSPQGGLYDKNIPLMWIFCHDLYGDGVNSLEINQKKKISTGSTSSDWFKNPYSHKSDLVIDLQYYT